MFINNYQLFVPKNIGINIHWKNIINKKNNITKIEQITKPSCLLMIIEFFDTEKFIILYIIFYRFF